MNITLEANPPNAPCCVKIVAEDGRDQLIQLDYDFPAIANTFGWNIKSVQKCDRCGGASANHINILVKYCPYCANNVGYMCDHPNTDGTVNCPDCGVTASEFISAARQWIDDNDGATAEDPGYFAL
jgi:hypothetical protein